mmetsp:Transcript_18209/g.46636  ORF Transcript_18209/g.46636 Transcript_18209/m.46636 type:complete len:162 (+) Transcript_18209:138-623(+)
MAMFVLLTYRSVSLALQAGLPCCAPLLGLALCKGHPLIPLLAGHHQAAPTKQESMQPHSEHGPRHRWYGHTVVRAWTSAHHEMTARGVPSARSGKDCKRSRTSSDAVRTRARLFEPMSIPHSSELHSSSRRVILLPSSRASPARIVGCRRAMSAASKFGGS